MLRQSPGQLYCLIVEPAILCHLAGGVLLAEQQRAVQHYQVIGAEVTCHWPPSSLPTYPT